MQPHPLGTGDVMKLAQYYTANNALWSPVVTVAPVVAGKVESSFTREGRVPPIPSLWEWAPWELSM